VFDLIYDETVRWLDHIIFAAVVFGIPAAIFGIATLYFGGHGTFVNDMYHRNVLKKLRPTRGLFRTSVFAAGVPFVSATDSGEDLSNNLFTDLAPILALFGDQVGPQFQCQIMTLE
jgi:hypothetical protein